MTGDVERAARVTVDPDLLDLAFHIYASPIVEDDESATHSGIAAAAFARLSGRPPAVWSDEDRALVEAVELRLGAFARLIEAGEGARLPLRIGGKTSPLSGDPLDIDAEVMALRPAMVMSGLAGVPVVLGDCALLRTGGVQVVLISRRNQAMGTDLFTQLGCDLARQRLIVDRMAEAARDAALHAELARLAIDDAQADALLQRLARLAAQAHALSGNFTALHLVTGCHAMHVLLRFVHDRGAALRAFWQAYGVAVVAAQLRPRPPVAPRPWPELVAAAIAHDDEHVIKLVEACREEERAYGGDDWRAAASRALAP